MKSKRKKPLHNASLEKLILVKVLIELIKSIVELINKLIE